MEEVPRQGFSGPEEQIGVHAGSKLDGYLGILLQGKAVVLGVTTVSGGGLALGRPLAVSSPVGGDFMGAATHVGGGELGEAVAPGVVGDSAPGFGVVLQVGSGFLSREVWKALANQGGHAGHMGGSLAGAGEPAGVASEIELFVGN